MLGLHIICQDCPWCGEAIELAIDPGVGNDEYVEDCQVCCAPIIVRIRLDDDPEQEPRVILSADR